MTDCWDALKFAVRNAKAWGADLEKGFIVGGLSAGGNLAAVMAHRARDEGLAGGAKITGLYLACAALCPREKMPEKYKGMLWSHEQNSAAPQLPHEAIQTYYAAFAPDLDHD